MSKAEKSTQDKPADGQPCKHPGCLSHVSHPCEGCGRIAGRNGSERYALQDLSDMEMRLLFNGLKLQAGDFEELDRSNLWGDDVDELKEKFPVSLRW